MRAKRESGDRGKRAEKGIPKLQNGELTTLSTKERHSAIKPLRSFSLISARELVSEIKEREGNF